MEMINPCATAATSKTGREIRMSRVCFRVCHSRRAMMVFLRLLHPLGSNQAGR